MELVHSFRVPVGVEQAWEVLQDIERIAPCMPGAAIDSVDGDDFTGTVKVKLGPIGLTYTGKAKFIEKDAANRRAVLEARGRDVRGAGTASATVTAVLTGDESSSEVSVTTELDITGKPAQLGRGMLAEVGSKLIDQFAASLAQTLEPDKPVAPETQAAQPGKGPQSTRPVKAIERDPDNSIDLGRTVLPVVAKQFAPYVLLGVLIVLVLDLARRSGERVG